MDEVRLVVGEIHLRLVVVVGVVGVVSGLVGGGLGHGGHGGCASLWSVCDLAGLCLASFCMDSVGIFAPISGFSISGGWLAFFEVACVFWRGWVVCWVRGAGGKPLSGIGPSGALWAFEVWFRGLLWVVGCCCAAVESGREGGRGRC